VNRLGLGGSFLFRLGGLLGLFRSGFLLAGGGLLGGWYRRWIRPCFQRAPGPRYFGWISFLVYFTLVERLLLPLRDISLVSFFVSFFLSLEFGRIMLGGLASE
jgi:hypothetical protein